MTIVRKQAELKDEEEKNKMMEKMKKAKAAMDTMANVAVVKLPNPMRDSEAYISASNMLWETNFPAS